ncbi:class I SAM-dependent methyltransferase [Terracidiphilus gabretensis]|jgi:SAM-dependent methyltransferase|uniref:class I SAM-dependent methyltransferase n=1 Tax=Terracidiphilus gabretensis TaxID=1577687 RepID=UPI00071B77B1|nr:class I SAM-dependent methyltransferase [Terracidiphilus gabretensis]
MGQPLTIYSGVNDALLSYVPISANRILDVGCGTGGFGEVLRNEREREVVGITYSSEEATLAEKRLSAVYCADLNNFDLTVLGRFDCVVMSHVLEHLYRPDEFLMQVRSILKPNGVIVVALPNVVFWWQRIQFMLGRWRYTDWGILDRTHFRFFDLYSSAELLRESGYEIVMRRCDGQFPLIKPLRPLIGKLGIRIDRFTSELAPGLFALQFLYLAKIANSSAIPPIHS